MHKLRVHIVRLVVFGLLFEALLPLGLAIHRPGTSVPIVICSQLGPLIVDAQTGKPLQDERQTSRSGQFCILCQALHATGLLPEASAYQPPVALAFSEQLPVPTGTVPQPMALRFGIFARPPPALA